MATILHGVGSLLESGADGLDVSREHFIAVSIIIILIISGSYQAFENKATGPRVRIRGSPAKPQDKRAKARREAKRE